MRECRSGSTCRTDYRRSLERTMPIRSVTSVNPQLAGGDDVQQQGPAAADDHDQRRVDLRLSRRRCRQARQLRARRSRRAPRRRASSARLRPIWRPARPPSRRLSTRQARTAPTDVRQPEASAERSDHLALGERRERDQVGARVGHHRGDANQRRRLAVVQGVEHSQQQLEQHVRHEAEREDREHQPDVPSARVAGVPPAEQDLAEWRAERRQHERRRHDDDGAEPDAGREVRLDQVELAVRRVPAHPRQQRGDHRDRDDRVRQLEQQPGVAVRREARADPAGLLGVARGARDAAR